MEVWGKRRGTCQNHGPFGYPAILPPLVVPYSTTRKLPTTMRTSHMLRGPCFGLDSAVSADGFVATLQWGMEDWSY